MSAHDEALVAELAEMTAASLGWDWPEAAIGDAIYPSGPDTIRPEVELILDRSIELGWTPSKAPTATVNGIVISIQPPPARDWFCR